MISNKKLKQLEARLGGKKRCKPVNFEAYNKQIGLSLDSIEKIEDLASPLQKSIVSIFAKQLALVDREIESYNRGEIDYPEALIRQVKPLLDSLARVTAFDVQIDMNKAFQAIERAGYEIIDPSAIEGNSDEIRN